MWCLASSIYLCDYLLHSQAHVGSLCAGCICRSNKTLVWPSLYTLARPSLYSSGLYKSGPAIATAGSAGGASKRAALKLLQQEPLQSVSSVIVYCTFQSQANEIAQYLYAQGISALSYHAGKSFKVDAFYLALAQTSLTALLQHLHLTKLLPATCIDEYRLKGFCGMMQT